MVKAPAFPLPLHCIRFLAANNVSRGDTIDRRSRLTTSAARTSINLETRFRGIRLKRGDKSANLFRFGKRWNYKLKSYGSMSPFCPSLRRHFQNARCDGEQRKLAKFVCKLPRVTSVAYDIVVIYAPINLTPCEFNL